MCVFVPGIHPNSPGSCIPGFSHIHTHPQAHKQITHTLRHTYIVTLAPSQTNTHTGLGHNVLCVSIEVCVAHLDSSSSRSRRQRGVSVAAMWPNVPNKRSAVMTSFMVTWSRHTNKYVIKIKPIKASHINCNLRYALSTGPWPLVQPDPPDPRLTARN